MSSKKILDPDHKLSTTDCKIVQAAGQGVYPDYIESSLLRTTLESTADGILVVDRSGKIITYNQKFRKMWHIPESLMKTGNDDDALRHVLQQLKYPEEFFQKVMNLYANPELDCFDEFEFADGRIFERYSIPQRMGKEIIGRVFSFRDVTQRKQMEEKLIYQATRDSLTDLPNRILLEDRIGQAIKIAKRQKTKVAILFIDLDRFKLVNDSLGHNIGDALLKTVAERLKGCLRDTDTIARWGGDEFIIILPDLGYREECIPIINLCQESLESIFSIDKHSINITSSVGVSFYPDDGNSITALLKNADAAMYNAKSNGRNNFCFYKTQMNEKAIEQLELGSDLHRALEEHEFFLQYQPLFDVKTDKIISIEALLRWQHPIRGLIPPIEFIQLAEESGLILPIGEWVLRTACQQLKAWQNMGLPPIKVAVNVSSIQFKQNHILQIVKSVLADTQLEAKYLDLELTEGIMMENTQLFISVMNVLKDIGVGLVIDDFGTGYSSLSYLKRFPVNKIKIDKSFIHDIHFDKDGRAIVQAIIAMARKLNLRVVAEGVETAEQMQFLKTHKCDEIQGYFYSRPLSANVFQDFLIRKSLDENDELIQFLTDK